jgi:DNA-binding NarL/FixJ family response regulator
MSRLQVLLADDHTVVAEGLKSLLESEFDLVGIVHDGRALLESVHVLQPHVIVTDLSMPMLNGLDAIRQIHLMRPNARIVVLTMHRDPQMAVEAFRAGALAYVLKVSPGEELILAIQQAALGIPYAATALGKDVNTLVTEAERLQQSERTVLTPRQREVLQLIAEGRTMKEIGTVLNISRRTAETHKYEMMAALGVNTVAALVQYAVRLKLVSDVE